MSDETIVSQRFVYDPWEFEYGDGLYLEPVETDTKCEKEKSMVVKFRKEGIYWVQISGSSIDGLDGDYGIQTLHALNKKYKPDELQVATKMCMTRMKKQGMTEKVLTTPLNDLSPEEFAFRVVDEMVNCEWKAQEDYIMSLVGPVKTSGCKGIKNTWGKILYPKRGNQGSP